MYLLPQCTVTAGNCLNLKTALDSDDLKIKYAPETESCRTVLLIQHLQTLQDQSVDVSPQARKRSITGEVINMHLSVKTFYLDVRCQGSPGLIQNKLSSPQRWILDK